jgi:GntR family transcriptional regulator
MSAVGTSTISRTRSTPLHDQIRRMIRGQIAAGELRPGDRLPTEHEYASRFGVSLAPVRQALLDLVSSGLLVRVKGRGTFVREAKVEESISLLTSFTESLRSRGEAFSMQVLDQRVEPAPTDVARRLGVRTGTHLVRLRRLARVRDEPAAILDARLPAARFGRLATIAGFDDGRSLYGTLEAEFDTRVGGAHSALEVVRCDEDEAELLGVSEGTPALLVRSVTMDDKGRPVEAADVLYRADRFTFTIDSER